MTDPADENPAAEVAALRRERDALERRAVEAETIAEALAEQLADAQRRLAAAPPTEQDDPRHLTVFDGADSALPGTRLAPDGSDPSVLPLALAATALVACLVGAMSVLARGGLALPGVAAFGAAAVLAWAAYRTRVVPRSVAIDDGFVVVTHGDDTKRFDLRNEGVKIDVHGSPGDDSWRVRFYRRALDPVDVDASMVDPEVFMRRLREVRPHL